MGGDKNNVVEYFIDAFSMKKGELVPEENDKRMAFLHEKEKDIELCNIVLTDRADYDKYRESLYVDKEAYMQKQTEVMKESVNAVHKARDNYDKINDEFKLYGKYYDRIDNLEKEIKKLDKQIAEEEKSPDREAEEHYINLLKEQKEEYQYDINKIKDEDLYKKSIPVKEALDKSKNEYLAKIDEQIALDKRQKNELEVKQKEIEDNLAKRPESYKKKLPEEKWVEIETSINKGNDQYTLDTFMRAEDRFISIKRDMANESVKLLKEDIDKYNRRHVEPVMKLTDYIYSNARQGRPLTNEAVTDYINKNMKDEKQYLYEDYPDMASNPIGAVNNPANQHKLLINYQQSMRMEEICDYMTSKAISIDDNLTDENRRDMDAIAARDYIVEMIEYKQNPKEYMTRVDKGSRAFFGYVEKASLISQAEAGKQLHTYDEAMAVATGKCRDSAEWFRTIKAKTYTLTPDWKDAKDLKDKEEDKEEDTEEVEFSKVWKKHRYDRLDSDLKQMAQCYDAITAYGGNLDMVEADCKKMRSTIDSIKKNVEQNRSSRQLYTHIGAMENLLFEIDIRREQYDKDREKENYFQNIERTDNSQGLAGMDKADIRNAGFSMQEEITSLEKKQEDMLFDEHLVGAHERERFMNEIKISVLKTKAENIRAAIDTDKKILEPLQAGLDKRSLDEKNAVIEEIKEHNNFIKKLDKEMDEYLDFKVDEIKAAMKGDGAGLAPINEAALSKEQIDRIRQGIVESDEMYISMKEIRARVSNEIDSYHSRENLAESLTEKLRKNNEEYDKCMNDIEALETRQLEILKEQGLEQAKHLDVEHELNSMDIGYDNIYEKTAMVKKYEKEISEKQKEYSNLNEADKKGERGNLLGEEIEALQNRIEDAEDDINRAYATVNSSQNRMLRSFSNKEPVTEEDKQNRDKLEKVQENVNNELMIEDLKDKKQVYAKAENTFHSYVKTRDAVGAKLKEIKAVLDKNTKKDDTPLYTTMKNALTSAIDKVSKAKSMKDMHDALQSLKPSTDLYIKERDSFFKFSTVGANRVVAAKNIRGVIESFSNIYKDNDNRIKAISEKNDTIGKQYGYSRENKPTKQIDKSFKELLNNPNVLDKMQKSRSMRLDKAREKYKKEIEKDIKKDMEKGM